METPESPSRKASGQVYDGMLRAKWGAAVWYTVALQWTLVLLVAVIAWAAFGPPSATSAFAGGAAVVFPNTLFALWLGVRMRLRGALSMTALLGGEVAKLALTVTLLVLAAKYGLRQPVWVAILVGMVVAVKAQWLALWFTRSG